jgi:DNA-binding NarL/FixJ family response regulator
LSRIIKEVERKVKIVLAQDQQVFRLGLKTLLNKQELFEVVGEVSSLRELLDFLRKVDSDIVILDSESRTIDSRKAVNKLIKMFQDIKILVIGVHSSDEAINDFIILGAALYISKFAGEEEFISSIKNAVNNKVLYDVELIRKIVAKKNGIPTNNLWFTDQEIIVYKEIRAGKKEKDIAKSLQLSINTIHSNKKNMFSKLGVHSVAELVSYAEKRGLA